MEPDCVLTSARWSASLRIAEPGEYLSEGPHVSVQIECYCKHVSEYGISSTVKDAFQEFPRNREQDILSFLDELRRLPLTEWDLMNLRFLIRVTNDLAAHLLQGESAKAWCEKMGLRPFGGYWKVRQTRKLPRDLFVRVGLHEYVLSPQGFFKRKKAQEMNVGAQSPFRK